MEKLTYLPKSFSTILHSVELSGCVGHARYGIPELRSGARALCNYACGASTKWKLCMRTKRSRRCDNFEHSTCDEGKR
eukprot:5762534-Pleurochrysis_carterae.AAC.2